MAEVDAALDKNLMAAVSGNEKLGYDTYKILSKEAREKSPKKPKNLLICPLSVETVLALAFMGAEGETAQQMATTLHIPNDKIEVADGFEKLTSNLKSSDINNVRLNVANKIFMSKNFTLSDKFKAIATKSFQAECENIDFLKKAEALTSINQWVSDKTETKIPKILDDVDSDTVTVLVNAVYFNGLWENEFTLNRFPMEFHVSEEEVVEVPSLGKKAYFNYYEDEDYQMVELPYKGNEYSMVIILPREVNGLEALESKLPIDLTKMSKCEVDVMIPKFKLEATIQFTDILPKMGMVVPFSDKADFSGMLTAGGKSVKISQVIQKCFIDVNEKGTEAAAATAVCMVACCAAFPADPILYVDHPFLYLLRSVKTNSTIFLGHTYNPKTE